MTFSAEYFNDKAEECHTKADQMLTIGARRSLLLMAESYHQLAERARHREELEARTKALCEAHQAKFGIRVEGG